MDRRLGELQAAVAAHGVDDVDEQRLGDGVAGEADERVDDLLGVVPGGPRVPQRQRGDAVGVDVLGGAFELREGSDRRAGLRSGRMVDLEQQGLVGLDDQGPVGHSAFPSYGPSTGRAVEARSGGVGNPGPTRPDTSARTHRHTRGCTRRGALRRKGYTPAPRTHACRADHTGLPRPSPSPSGRVETRSGPASGRPADRPVPTRRSDGSADDSDAPRARTFLLRARPPSARPGPTPSPSSTASRAHLGSSTFANRRSHVSQCGRTSSAIAVYYKSWGTWA